MSRPKCPNHTCEMDKTNVAKIYICPISGYRFEVNVDDKDSKVKKDKFGRVMKSFDVKPLDGKDG